MKRITDILSSASLCVLPVITHAQIANSGGGGQFEVLLDNILDFTNDVLIPFIIGIGFLVFVFGMFRYFIAGGANDDAKQSGKSLMIYATLGFVLIIVFWGVVNLITDGIGLGGDNIDNIPVIPDIN